MIEQGVTPKQVTLDAKAFPFWPAKYTVVMAGNQLTSQRHEVKASLDPWIAGNLLIGGGAGAIVDGATGAMFRLPERVSGNVSPQYAITDPQVGYPIASSEIRSGESPHLPQAETALPVMPASHVKPSTPSHTGQ